MSRFQFVVVTPERTVLDTQVESAIVPADSGLMGILAHHGPMMVNLTVGVVYYGPSDGQKRKMAMSGGILEIKDNRVQILADTAELGEEIDVMRAREDKERAEQHIREQTSSRKFSQTRVLLQKALSRLEAADDE